ncbi:carbohydrate porin [Reyranella sp.]|uniref:carbohydrate porin n=2 Tax=Reyranella sp. TaxID=1929291 RepID=UPI003D0F4B53
MRPATRCGLVLAAALLSAEPVEAQQAGSQRQSLVGKVHDKNRAARKRHELSLADEADHLHRRFARARQEIEEATGITFSMEASLTSQWGTPNGGFGAFQTMFTPAVNWAAFDLPEVGAGSFQFHFLSANYLTATDATALGGSINLISPINNQPTANNQFVQVTYTHSFPGNWLSLSFGQYPLSNFDGNAYANDQQVNFIGFSLTQNGSQNYAQAGIGAYAQVNPTREITLAAGFQDANDISGSYIQTTTFGQGQYAWFGYGAWSPTISGWGQGTYSLLYYSQPSVTIQPIASEGLSFNAAQPIGERLGLFVRANTAWRSSFAIQSSIAAGGVVNDPLRRSPQDQIGLAMAWNATNMSLFAGTGARPSETMLEAYWSWSIYRTLVVTPDIQLYLQPALAPSSDLSAVFTIRVTQLF